MKFFKKIALLCFFSFSLLSSLVQANDFPIFELYYGAECPHCHEEMKWLNSIQEAYPELKIEKFEVWHNSTNKKLWQQRMTELNHEIQGVPTNIIGDQVIVGFKKHEIEKALELAVEDLSNEKNTPIWEEYLDWSWPVMSFVLGIIDGFNPCAMWTLFMLISLLLVIEDKRKRWLIGGVFLSTSGLIYGAALLAYLFGFQSITSIIATSLIQWVFRLVGLVAVIIGGLTLKNARNSGIDCSVRDAGSKRKFHQKLKNILERKNFGLVLAGIAGLAISVNAVELLCSFAIPTAFTATLVAIDLSLIEKLTGVLLYDIAYMLDDLIVFTIAMKTLSLKVFSPKIPQIMHWIGGTILLLLGLVLLLKPALLTII
jgi:cytochrome c biogenesis protein CcdA/glutaredoxin